MEPDPADAAVDAASPRSDLPEWPEAEQEIRIALASPSAPAEAHWTHACMLSTFGRFEESTEEMRRAVEKDPLSAIWRGILVAHLVCAGRYDEAVQE